MTTWRHIVVEAFCLAPYDAPPCGKRHVSPYCLGHGQAKCPWLSHNASSTERDAALYVPLASVLWDRAALWLGEAWSLARWWLREKWQYDPAWIEKHVKSASAEYEAAMEQRNRKTDAAFGVWLARQREIEKEMKCERQC